jgi:hypothetical protein
MEGFRLARLRLVVMGDHTDRRDLFSENFLAAFQPTSIRLAFVFHDPAETFTQKCVIAGIDLVDHTTFKVARQFQSAALDQIAGLG